MLDGSGRLSPLSPTGWNLYGNVDLEQKKEVAKSGLRTDLVPPVDRNHGESIIPSIPTVNVLFCVLHGLARCVEKLLNLEIDNIISEKNKLIEASSSLSGSDLIHNLEANINKRGVIPF